MERRTGGWRPAQGSPQASRAQVWLACLGWLAALILCFVLASTLSPHGGQGIAGAYVLMQDRWLLALALGVALLSALTARIARFRFRPRGMGFSPRAVAVLAVLSMAAAVAGRHWLLLDYDLSRDEQMATFDAWIYAHGRLAWPLPPEWRVDFPMLNNLFMLPVGRPVAWISSYLPGHTGLRALIGLIAPNWLGGSAFTGPLMLGVSLWLLWSIARTMLTREGASVAVLMLLLSGQSLFASMSAFAMPAHLAVNLLWLRLFLANRPRADVAALAVGFFGTGLHQPLFHPMFVAPWLALLLVRGEWRRLGLYGVVYGASGLFWLAWPHVTHSLIWGPGSFESDVGTSYLSRLLDLLAQNEHNLSMMSANLLRFTLWNHLALIPLAALGAGLAFRDGRVAALLAGLVLPVIVMVVILPYQGYGFGYRYLHGLLGNAALLAGFGWQRLAPWHTRLRPALAVASLGTLGLMVAQGSLTHRLYAAFSHENDAINASGADYTIIGGNDGAFALDLILNRPDLSNRPLRLSIWEIEDADALAARLCRGGGKSIALPQDSFFAQEDALFGRPASGEANQRFAETAQAFKGAGCGVKVLK
ncbi:hypothetical protein [Novosphingobium rosa]|uniref:hypothetical protein n=1 Tax=Novosphingobium rosa TaxID=76978 RepID=UPI00082B9DA0|nr:hypothetical protein [Novosphingobium rosa]